MPLSVRSSGLPRPPVRPDSALRFPDSVRPSPAREASRASPASVRRRDNAPPLPDPARRAPRARAARVS